MNGEGVDEVGLDGHHGGEITEADECGGDDGDDPVDAVVCLEIRQYKTLTHLFFEDNVPSSRTQTRQ